VTRALTRSDGFNEMMPSWSPDGKWIAYLSDESGEYELWVRAADTRPPTPEAEAKKDGAAGEKKGEEGSEKAATPTTASGAATLPAPRRLTSLGAGYRFNPVWTPDSKKIAMTDQNGRIFVVDVESGATKEVDKDPGMGAQTVSFTPDSRYMAYSKTDKNNRQTAIWIADLKDGGEPRRVTDPMFSSGTPAFDRKGDFLFFSSKRSVTAPTYSDLDTTFAYNNTDTIHMVPLRADVKNPWLPKSDEEIEKKDDAKEGDQGAGEKKADAKAAAASPADDPVSGRWSATAKGVPAAPDGIPFTLTIKRAGGNAVEGTLSSAMGGGSFKGTFEAGSGEIRFDITLAGETGTLIGTVKDGKITGTWSAGQASGSWSAERTDTGSGGDDSASGDKKDEAKKDKDEVKPVKIDFDDFERRAMMLPITPGSFSRLEVADGEKLIFRRNGARGGEPASGIKVYGYMAEEKKEELVTASGDFEVSRDGKKLLVRSGPSLSIVDASAGGKSQSVSLSDMRATIDPRAEWGQIFSDAWRLTRDYFYESTLHGVDWPKIGEHYRAMLPDAASREDVNWIISEMISELNIGHAYLGRPGDVEDGVAPVGVGLLGADFELAKTDAGAAYRIVRVYDGAAWDSDARGPLAQPGVNVKAGEYVLAVNGVPIDTTRDIWYSFIGTADRVTSITVSGSPVMDGTAREIVIKPLASDTSIRYRAWIERNRQYVFEKSGGKIGYIYVPNTGVDGQNDLFRQFYGQRGMDALIIDERWNGGGQIPTRFIELLNRPRTNYWARRDGVDWGWPPDSHQGPKAMLVNGLAGSGGDMFPWLFRFNKLGPIIGTRTWGGLVGISGNPAFIDGGNITVPTFGFYKKDGNWGVEGHGVDPDIEVLDDPAKMQNGADPQIDKAIEVLLADLAKNPYTPPQRPAGPDRKGMGIPPEQR
jgi:C-terminal processing protease CtpA/Prc